MRKSIRVVCIQLIVVCAFLLVFMGCKDKNVADSPPNIILILTDDQGFGDLGYYGNPNIKTPVLDSLARNSVRFDEFLVNPVCAPTRAALMTGRYPLTTGIRDTYKGGANMATSEVTLAEVLQSMNYSTGMIGKWHLGDNYPMRPQDQGFDFALHHLAGGIGQYGDWPNTLKWEQSYFNPVLWRNGEQYQSSGYCSDVFTQEALDFINKHKENPFFLYLSYNAPHDPFQLPQEYYDMYKDIDPDAGLQNGNIPFPEVNEGSKEIARKVYGMVSNIDDNLGVLFEHLRNLKLDEDTLIIFMTDNGPRDPRYLAGMRGKKSSVFQGGVRVPSFWYYPKKFNEARDISSPVAHYDVLPTIAELVGANIDSLDLEGVSLLPLLLQKKTKLPERYINRYWTREAPVRYRNISSRRGDLKLVGNGKDSLGQDKFELFDLGEDPYEQHNILNENLNAFKDLKGVMDSWLDNIENSHNAQNPPLPIIGTAFENPSYLNQNDAVFVKNETYNKQTIFWDVEVAVAKSYDIVLHFDRKLEKNGSVALWLGDEVLEFSFEGVGQTSIARKGVALPAGTLRIFPKIFEDNEDGSPSYTAPFYVEIKG